MYFRDYIIYVYCFRYGGGGSNVVLGLVSRFDYEGFSVVRGILLLLRLL